MATDLLIGIGAAGLLPCDAQLPLLEHHPVANPGFQLQVTVDADVVTSADARVGLMHRSAEKLFESRDLRQAMALADRHDWLSAFSSEVGVALTLESALGITPPERATWIRTLLAEANRISASLAFLCPVAGEVRADLEALRERLTSLQEQVTGGRVHPGFARIGGVAAAIDAASLDDYSAVPATLGALQPRIADGRRRLRRAARRHRRPLAVGGDRRGGERNGGAGERGGPRPAPRRSVPGATPRWPSTCGSSRASPGTCPRATPCSSTSCRSPAP